MACTWSPMLVYAVLGQAKWVYMSDILRLKRPIRLYVPICTTYCPFCRHIPGNAPTNSTPRFCQRSLKIGRQAFPAARLRFVCDPNRTYPIGTGPFHFGLGWLQSRRSWAKARTASREMRATQAEGATETCERKPRDSSRG